MKKHLLIAAAVAALTALSCSKEAVDVEPAGLPEGEEVILTAGFGDDDATRTIRQADGKVYWSAKDEIAVVRGTNVVGNKFVSTNTAPAPRAQFQGTMPSGKRFNFMLQYWNQPVGGVHPKGGSVMFRRKLLTRQVPDDGQYHYYYIGTTRLFPESLIHTAGIRHGSGVMTGLLYDFKNPEQRYDVHISLKRKGKKLWFDEMLFVKSDKPDTWEKSGGAPKNAKTAENERN